ncbi:Ger(x)C family spore germination protein [Paenibacillus gansuensis]|uniref:Ger(X)C family spore germination protein n=1 Tax=Paenibacillus gansuensis TaxID=306542 RepID=A0ABW5PIF2_9BACL
MMKPFLFIGLLITLVTTSGCWDRKEVNDLAFISATAFDLTKDGNYILSHQIAIPSTSQGGQGSGGGSQQEKFFVTTATGKDISEAFQKLQKKTSRMLFTSHRTVIYVGESLAKYGMQDILDVYTHDPRQRLRTYIMAVKGGEGREILKVKYPFEQVPAEAVKEMVALGTGITLRDFFLAASGEGIQPCLGVIERDALSEGGRSESKNKLFKLGGSALFKNLKLVGFLNDNETNGYLWLTNRMKTGVVSGELPNKAGSIGMILVNASRKITSKVSGDKIKINIQVHGEGSLWENNSRLDVSLPENLKIVRKSLEKSVEKQATAALSALQKRYKVDCIGLGQEIYRNHPKQWRALKERWDQKFPEVEVSVQVKLDILGSGMAGAPLQLNEKEIKK